MSVDGADSVCAKAVRHEWCVQRPTALSLLQTPTGAYDSEGFVHLRVHADRWKGADDDADRLRSTRRARHRAERLTGRDPGGVPSRGAGEPPRPASRRRHGGRTVQAGSGSVRAAGGGIAPASPGSEPAVSRSGHRTRSRPGAPFCGRANLAGTRAGRDREGDPGHGTAVRISTPREPVDPLSGASVVA